MTTPKVLKTAAKLAQVRADLEVIQEYLVSFDEYPLDNSNEQILDDQLNILTALHEELQRAVEISYMERGMSGELILIREMEDNA